MHLHFYSNDNIAEEMEQELCGELIGSQEGI